ncbi:MAG: OmpA family protein [Bacteroidales bacterium]|nr:OmpA family protein [Bacteroidales bacterium]
MLKNYIKTSNFTKKIRNNFIESLYLLSILLFTLIFNTNLFSQDIAFSSNYFPNNPGLKEAKKNIKNGNSLFIKGEGYYTEALEYYLKANQFNSDNAELNYKIGICYLYSADIEKALEHIEKAYRLNKNVNDDITYYLAQAYHLNLDFDKAILYYQTYLNVLKPRDRDKHLSKINKKIEECNNGKELIKDTVKVLIDNLGGTVNSIYPDYAPVISADEAMLIFTSRRPGNIGGMRDPINGKYFEDIYIAYMEEWGKWLLTQPSAPLNDKYHNAAIGLSPDGQTLYVYKGVNGGDIYVSYLKGKNWTNPEPLPAPINSKYHESSASLGPDGRTLYFVSDRPGGIGGRDIWMARMDNMGNWTNPINLSSINTPYDEEGVFIHPDGRTLYFSSKGHNSMGGYDIFRSVYQDGKWSKPVNLGYPINTPDDDLYFVLSASGIHAYISSSRKGTLGDQDIFMITYLIAKPVMPSSEANLLAWRGKPSIYATGSQSLIAENLPSMILWKGKVIDEENNPLEAQIILTDNVTGEQLAVFTSNSETGNFLVSLPSGKNYGIAVKKEGYLFHSENFNIPENAPYEELNKDIILKKVAAGAEIVLNNIFFDFNKATLRPESKTELQNVIEFMQQNPSVIIEISGHTDNIGSYEYNQSLSERRAKAVVDYLVEHGIPLSRFVYKGYSFSEPIATNDTEEGRQLNRRVEFKILAADEVYKSDTYIQTAKSETKTIKAEVQPIETTKTTKLIVEEEVKKVEPVKEEFKKEVPAKEIIPTKPTPQKLFHIVGASVTNINDAEKIKNEYIKKGYIDATILPRSDGKGYRIAYKSFTTKEEAIKELEILKKETKQKDLWILQQ